ncbi:hypothetical protein [Tsuneonella rigui]|uniref:hypothetical protein n=1 Tax=Tsuneonella rigui TaxID=1708790 RepID=UPI000F7E2D82|nr:hypothetical protein [Tsuneonella rigui]
MKLLICIAGLLFCLFPYTQVIPLETYNQPYASIFAGLTVVVTWPLLVERFPRMDALALITLAVIGLLAFVLTCLPRPNAQEVKYLLIYLSPAIFAAAGFATVILYPKQADRAVLFAAVAWIFVGLVQTLFQPDFATGLVGVFGNAAGDIVDSGRGTLGLAPEPTHFGFHMIILAAALLLVGGRNGMAIACLVTAVLIARSSSAVLSLALGGFIFLCLFAKWARLGLLLIVPFYLMVGAIVHSGALPADLRITSLLTEFYQDPLYLVTSDASTNARLGGIYVGVQEIFKNLFLPAGLSSETWLARVGPIMSENLWLMNLSYSGIPSGILIVIYQIGIFGLLLLGFLLYRLLTGLRSHFETLLICAAVFVFFSQYLISTPGFGLLYGLALARRQVGIASTNRGDSYVAARVQHRQRHPYATPVEA